MCFMYVACSTFEENILSGVVMNTPAGAETTIFPKNFINTTTADALAFCVTRTSSG